MPRLGASAFVRKGCLIGRAKFVIADLGCDAQEAVLRVDVYASHRQRHANARK